MLTEATSAIHPRLHTQTVLAPTAPSLPRVRPPVAVWVVAVVVVGLSLRVLAFVSAGDLWIDEAMLALNLVARSPAQLMEPLDHNQGAPVGFLLAVKASISAFGTRDWVFRLVPLLASVTSLFVFVWVARKLLSNRAAILASVLFAVSPHLVSYACECKQYASDAAIAVVLLACACGLLQGKGGAARDVLLALAGALAVWCSHPSVFVLGGIGTALFLRAVAEHDRSRAVAVSVTIAVWLASFTVCYFLCLKQLSANRYLTDYWTGQFLTFPPRGVGDCVWVLDRVVSFFTLPGGFGSSHMPLAAFAMVFACLGLREFARENWSVAVAVLTTAVLVLIASGLQKYPAGGRLLLFAVPGAVMCVARGVVYCSAQLVPRDRVCAGLFVAVPVLASAWECADTLRKPPRAEQLNAVLTRMRGELDSHETVYVYYGAIPAYQFYTRANPLAAERVILGGNHRGNIAGYREELAHLKGTVWVVFSHRHADEATAILAILGCRGVCDREILLTGAAAYRFRLE